MGAGFFEKVWADLETWDLGLATNKGKLEELSLPAAYVEVGLSGLSIVCRPLQHGEIYVNVHEEVKCFLLDQECWIIKSGAEGKPEDVVKNLCDQLEAFGMKNYDAEDLSQIMKGVKHFKIRWDKAEDNDKRETRDARHEHIKFSEVKRARDAVFDFSTHNYAFFTEVGSSVSSQGQQGSYSVADVVDPGSGRFPQWFDPQRQISSQHL
ncbi:hypothetical protein M9H77_18934 [Catharanthus roseus]|uniref:Uncharacterized protein n=1 Tax=Catharanthus roseus TaxID=4058 RepID=A0ACC0B8V8_CATRO|nr:hypothetical protein M9H77_18934 [Catharanthus roseus]